LAEMNSNIEQIREREGDLAGYNAINPGYHTLVHAYNAQTAIEAGDEETAAYELTHMCASAIQLWLVAEAPVAMGREVLTAGGSVDPLVLGRGAPEAITEAELSSDVYRAEIWERVSPASESAPGSRPSQPQGRGGTGEGGGGGGESGGGGEG